MRDYEYNDDERTQSPRLTAARLQLAVGRRGLGPREQGDHRTQRASFVVRIMREYTKSSSSSRAGLGCLFHVKHVGTSLRGLNGMLPYIGADACERLTAQRHSTFPGQNEGAQELRRGTVGWVAQCSERGVRRMLPALARW